MEDEHQQVQHDQPVILGQGTWWHGGKFKFQVGRVSYTSLVINLIFGVAPTPEDVQQLFVYSRVCGVCNHHTKELFWDHIRVHCGTTKNSFWWYF